MEFVLLQWKKHCIGSQVTFDAFNSMMCHHNVFYSHHNHEGDVIIIPFTMGTHQGDPLGGALFTLAHFRALHFIINHFPSSLFPSIMDETHII